MDYILDFSYPSKYSFFLYLGFFLASLQVFDGVLTRFGVKKFGTIAEGNLVLRTLMEQFSPEVALVIVKAGAILAVVVLTVLAKK